MIEKKLKQEEITEDDKQKVKDAIAQVGTILNLLKESLDMSDEQILENSEKE